MTYKQPSRWNPVTFNGQQFFDQEKLGEEIQKKYHIKGAYELTTCDTCHR